MPPKPIGTRPMTGAERQAKFAARQAEIEAKLEASRLETIEGLRATLMLVVEYLDRALEAAHEGLKK